MEPPGPGQRASAVMYGAHNPNLRSTSPDRNQARLATSSAVAMVVAVVYMPAAGWVRAFLALGLLYVVTSTVVLCKVVRDRQEMSEVSNRVDQARLDKLLAEHDPFKVDG